MVETVTITETDDGPRLGPRPQKHYPALAFGQMQKILRTGQLRVDGKRVKGDARLVKGQQIRVPPQLSAPTSKKEKTVSQRDADFIKSIVIYEDDDIIAINKPAGIASQ